MSVEDILLDNGLEGAAFFQNPDYADAIIGYTDTDCVAYSYEKMLECLMKEDAMTFDEAMEWIDYNVIRSLPYMGDQAPVIIYEFM